VDFIAWRDELLASLPSVDDDNRENDNDNAKNN